uniref:Uncharacterized protein n=1 Tax=Nelumbo nucifera TaxID=4432 RepID=A0A822ZNR3_NELNU|nr:TPA_asm: hypothetical protein HUJ06_016380 [Nelumbo nucifera]
MTYIQETDLRMPMWEQRMVAMGQPPTQAPIQDPLQNTNHSSLQSKERPQNRDKHVATTSDRAKHVTTNGDRQPSQARFLESSHEQPPRNDKITLKFPNE